MKYSDLSVFETHCVHAIKYHLCRRCNPNKKTGKFIGVYKNTYVSFPSCFSLCLINANMVNDLFSEDGEYMIVEAKDGGERVILPNELKMLLDKHYDDIVENLHMYDNPPDVMNPLCQKILDAIDTNIK